MKYIAKKFLIDGVKAETLAKRYSTPIYCYSFKKLKKNILYFKKNFKVNDKKYSCLFQQYVSSGKVV